MKNFSVLLLFLGLMSACVSNNENEMIAEVQEKPSLRVSDFQRCGELHNEILERINRDFVNPTDSTISEVSYLDNLCSFSTKIVCEFDGFVTDEGEVMKQFNKYKECMNHRLFSENVIAPIKTRSSSAGLTLEDIKNMYRCETIDVENIPCISEVAEVLHKEGLMSRDAFLLYKDIIDEINDAYLGLTSDAVFEDDIDDFVQRYDALQYDTASVEGKNLGAVLAVTKFSLQWWRENPDANTPPTKIIQAVVVQDAAGAVVGALGSYVVSGSVTWQSVVWGAASSSLGLLPKVATFINAFNRVMFL